MDKRLLFSKNYNKERDIFFVKEDRPYLQKHASAYHPKVQNYIQNAKPIENLIQVLLTALGGYPVWPQNVNGDRFLIPSLEHEGDDYGYQTFLSNANYFTHHVNSDPALAKGKVLAAVWNDKAKRVELIVGIDPSKDPDAASEIDSGSNLCFSMGAKLPFDVCSVCGNKARTRLEYCDHLRYQMNQMDPITGLLVGALNPQPKFFDISRVLIPADKTAYMWEKVASAASPISKLGSAEIADIPAAKLFGDKYILDKVAMKQEAWNEKRGSVRKQAVSKQADIEKQIPVAEVKPLFVEKLKRMMPVAKQALDNSSPDLDMNMLKGYTLPQILSTLLALAIVPKASEAEELCKLFIPNQNMEYTNNIGPQAFSQDLARKLLPIVHERSFARPILMRRIIVLAAKPGEELRKIASKEHRDMFHAGLAAGLIAAALAYGGEKTALTNLIAQHPFLATILGSAMIRNARSDSGKPLVTGEVSLAEPGNPLYNTGWQRRFAESQAHPVTVIKTGADNTIFDDVFGGIPLLFALEGTGQQPAQFIERNPHIFAGSLMTKESGAISQNVSDVLVSARRFMKSASLENLEFLEGVPQSSQNSVWDLAILNAADKIMRKIS